ncbi:MAG TPA: hypothetical protein VGM01_15290 [Ktedonobacteraceae bacterium]|jgi:hypothetical protein
MGATCIAENNVAPLAQSTQNEIKQTLSLLEASLILGNAPQRTS